MLKTTTIAALCGLTLTALTGCRQAPTVDATPASSTGASSTPKADAPVKMTPSQTLGLTILKALNANAAMSGHSISVGTSNNTVTLNGKVKSALQSQTAQRIAQKNAKGFKVVNSLKVEGK